jgi:hypothetical protein
MAWQKLFCGVIACLTLGAIGGTLMPAQDTSTKPPSLRGLTDEERQEAIEKWVANQRKRIAHVRGLADEEKAEVHEVHRKKIEDRILKKQIARDEYLAERRRQAMRNELRVSEAQWRIIEPKYKRQYQLMKDTGARSSSVHSEDSGHRWIKPTEFKSGKPGPLTFEELSEAYKNVDKLVDLLRREDTTDEELRKQIDALQQAREKARKEWPRAKQELAATLTTPRQEAVFLLLGYID